MTAQRHHAAAAAALLLMMLIGALFFAPYAIERQGLSWLVLDAEEIIDGLAVIGLSLVVAALLWKRPREALGMRRWRDDRTARLAIASGLAISLVLSFIAMQGAASLLEPDQAAPAGQNGVPALLLVVTAMVFVAPLAEELFFRGILFRLFEDWNLPFLAGASISSVLWAMIHIGRPWPVIAVLFPIGMILSFLRARTGSLLAPLVMHSCFNLYSSAVMAVVAIFLAH